MKKGKYTLLSVVVAMIFGASSCTYDTNQIEGGGGEIPLPDPAYIGSSSCAICHQDIYESFQGTGHPYVLSKSEGGDAPEYPYTSLDYVPPFFPNQWNDVSYVIGGFAWKYQVMDQNGYIYTGDDAQYNFQNSSISEYHPDIEPGTKTYDCGKCHTTGWISVDEGGEPKDDLAGMGGDFFAAGVQCEACHGKGNRHAIAQDPGEIMLNRNASECGKCHSRNDDQTVAAADNFILHYQQYAEMTAAGHKDLSCVDCHDPHATVKHNQPGGIIKQCTDCHAEITNPTHLSAECTDCHLPMASKSAVNLNKYVGDVKTHIFKINTAADGEMFNQDGTLANAENGVTLAYACYSCHRDASGIGGKGSIKTLEELSKKAIDFHK